MRLASQPPGFASAENGGRACFESLIKHGGNASGLAPRRQPMWLSDQMRRAAVLTAAQATPRAIATARAATAPSLNGGSANRSQALSRALHPLAAHTYPGRPPEEGGLFG